MFQDDIPIAHGVFVLICIIVFYKLVVYMASRNKVLHRLLEGKEMLVVKEGMFYLKYERDNDFSQMEFFTELRNQSVEHLGQVREALLEPDGSLSVLYYADEEVKYGLPLFPSLHSPIDMNQHQGPFACMYCGFTAFQTVEDQCCPTCKRKEWTVAIRTKRIA